MNEIWWNSCFFKFHESQKNKVLNVFMNPYESLFIVETENLFKHLDGALYILWIKSLNGIFIALQKKSFAKKKSKLHAWVKKCHFGNISERAWMAVPC